MFRKFLLCVAADCLFLLAASAVSAQILEAAPQGTTKPQPRHAAVKAASFLVKAPYKGAKGVLYSVLFTAEIGVDGAHAALDVADKVTDVVSANSKVPVLAEVYVVISQANKDVAKLDGWLERQEQGLFGTHN